MKKTLNNEKIPYHTSGTIEKLGHIVSLNKIDIDVAELISIMPKYLVELNEDQQNIFKSYFWRQMNIYDIYNTFKYKSCEDVECELISAITSFIDFLKSKYGVK